MSKLVIGNKKTFSSLDCLALVERSPAAVKAHDKQAWLSIFSAGATVEDPVGSRPHRNEAGRGRGKGDSLGRFYETFIAANDIRFHVHRDIICGLQVVRDLTIEIRMSPEVTVRVPAHLLYELVEEGGSLKVERLAAHWELGPMLRQQLVPSLAYLKVGMASFRRMLRYQGLVGCWGFIRALSCVGQEGKDRVVEFTNRLNEHRDISTLFVCSDPIIGFPYSTRQLTSLGLKEQGGRLEVCKLLASGSTVSATFSFINGRMKQDGVAFFEFDRETLLITRLDFYWPD